MLVSTLYTNRQPNRRPHGNRTHSSVLWFWPPVPLGVRSSTTKLVGLIKLLVLSPQANGIAQSVFAINTNRLVYMRPAYTTVSVPIGDTILNIFPLKSASSFSFPKTYLSYMSVSIILPFRFTNRIKHFQNFSSVFI